MSFPRFRGCRSIAILGALAAVCGGLIARPVSVSHDAVSPPPSTTGRYQLAPQGRASLQAYVRGGELPALRWPRFRKFQAPAKKFYDSFGSTLPWIGEDGNPTSQAVSMIRLLEDAESKGLRAEDYDHSRWDARLTELSHGPASENDLIQFDLALTVSAMRYLSDVHYGQIDPRRIAFELGFRRKKLDLAGFLQSEIVSSRDVCGAIEKIEPLSPAYRYTLHALKTYRDLARRDDGEHLPVLRKPVNPGDAYAGLPRLTRLLTLLGDLPSAAEKRGQELAYEGALVNAVKHFQARHGLEADGRLGWRTLQEMNVPLSRRVAQLESTLERWRWVTGELAPPYLVVNIPEFALRAFNEDYQKALSMKVVVGKAYRHETPTFLSMLSTVIFRPYWNVPAEIQVQELLPDIEKKPTYLTDNDYEVVDSSGNIVTDGPASDETIEGLRTGNLSIRQRPGLKNALGLIKFEFPNPFDVYMHGTPATALFSRSRRDFSHGCIRVEDPVGLTAWALRETPGWDVEHIRAAMDGEETVRVNLKKPIPVLIAYNTAIATEEGEIHFFKDIYGYDADLESALARSTPDSR